MMSEEIFSQQVFISVATKPQQSGSNMMPLRGFFSILRDLPWLPQDYLQKS